MRQCNLTCMNKVRISLNQIKRTKKKTTGEYFLFQELYDKVGKVLENGR